MMISLILFEGISDRQANDFKRALRGRQPTCNTPFSQHKNFKKKHISEYTTITGYHI